MKTILLSTLIIALLCNCKDSRTQENQQAPTQDTTVRHQEAEAHEQHTTAVSLNGGEKWTANAATTEGISNMMTLMSGFPSNPNADDYKSLKTKLEKEFNQILEKCTMTGEAHTQLHNYLLPMQEMFNRLVSEDKEVRQHAVDQLTKHLAEYKNYFI